MGSQDRWIDRKRILDRQFDHQHHPGNLRRRLPAYIGGIPVIPAGIQFIGRRNLRLA